MVNHAKRARIAGPAQSVWNARSVRNSAIGLSGPRAAARNAVNGANVNHANELKPKFKKASRTARVPLSWAATEL
jgi:hypothetical protein